MRAGSISRPSAISTICASAPEVTSASAGKVAHSDAQFPAERSCSWISAARMEAARCGAICAQARAVAQATGFRLCGMVDEPPRPAAAGSETSPISVCISSETSRAIFPQVPARMAKALATSPSRSRWLCQGASGSGSPSSCASPSATSKPRLPSAASVPAAPPNCSTSASSRNRFRRPRERDKRRRIAGGFQPERHRQSLLQPRARHGRRLAMLDRHLRKRADGAVKILHQGIDGRAQIEHQRGVDDVLAGGAPMHVTGGNRRRVS